MPVDLQISVTCAVWRMKQPGVRGQPDQDVGLGRAAPTSVAVLLGDGVVERDHAAARLLELFPQGLESGTILALQLAELLQHVGRKGRAGIGGDLFN